MKLGRMSKTKRESNEENKQVRPSTRQSVVVLNPTFRISREKVDEYELNDILSNHVMRELHCNVGHYIGYQTSERLPRISHLFEALEMQANNVGDPFIKSALLTNTKEIERSVLHYCAELWHLPERIENDPQNKENYWGYVLNMGSTEGNLNGLWNAREFMEQKGHKNPVSLFSDESHYSVDKAVRILCLDCEKIASDVYGRVVGTDLIEKVQKYAEEKRAIIVVLTMGTTFTGAYDDHKLISQVHHIAETNQVPCWVHIDAALGGFIMPFLERGLKNGKINTSQLSNIHKEQTVPHIGFDLNIQSCTASFHKWFGAPFPCGVFMTKNKYLRMSKVPGYIGSPDTTLGGSRNAFSCLYIWSRFSLITDTHEAEDVLRCLNNARDLEYEFARIDKELGDLKREAEQFKASRAPWSLSVTFNAPQRSVIKQYSIPTEYNKKLQTRRAHIFAMKHVTKDLLNEFVSELRQSLGLNVSSKNNYASGEEQRKVHFKEQRKESENVDSKALLTKIENIKDLVV